jgi:ATP-dependent helicase/nuclease subunit B
MAEVYHGLALQLLAYLLVLREHGGRLSKGGVRPVGAFYLPLLSGFQKVDHPGEADEGGFDPLKAFRPRGVIDFDALGSLDPGVSGWSRRYSAYVKNDGSMGYVDVCDATSKADFDALLDHVRARLTELAERLLGGEIAVAPARMGRQTPCSRCDYRAVCRFEYASGAARSLEVLSRSEVFKRVTGGGP